MSHQTQLLFDHQQFGENQTREEMNRRPLFSTASSRYNVQYFFGYPKLCQMGKLGWLMAMDLYSLAFRTYGLQHPWTDLWISFKLLFLLASVSIHHNKLNASFQRYINLVVPSIPDGSSRFRLLKGFVILSPQHLFFITPNVWRIYQEQHTPQK